MSGTLVLGIGNRLGCDDAAGPSVADMLNGRERQAEPPLPTDITAIDVGTVPESYTSTIRRQHPDLLILIDAADMRLPPGTVRLIPPEKLSTLSFSTHYIPLATFVSYVDEFCGQVLLVGVQPCRMEIGERISQVVQRSLESLCEIILQGRTVEIAPLE